MAVDALARALAAGKVPVDAYEMAVAGGYTGTKEQFETDMGNSATNATNAANSATSAAQDAASIAASAAQIATNTGDIADLKNAFEDSVSMITNKLVVDTTNLQTVRAIINASGNWYQTSGSNLGSSSTIKILDGAQTLKLKGGTSAGFWALLKTYNPSALSGAVDFSASYPSRQAFSENPEVEITIPSDANYLFFTRSNSGGADETPQLIEFKSSVVNMNDFIPRGNIVGNYIRSIPSSYYYANEAGVSLKSGSNANYGTLVIPVEPSTHYTCNKLRYVTFTGDDFNSQAASEQNVTEFTTLETTKYIYAVYYTAENTPENLIISSGNSLDSFSDKYEIPWLYYANQKTVDNITNRAFGNKPFQQYKGNDQSYTFEYPNSIKRNKVISFSCDLSAMGSGTIEVGLVNVSGENAVSLIIDNTSFKVSKNGTVGNPTTHGLTISNRISVVMTQTVDKILFEISSNGEKYSGETAYSSGFTKPSFTATDVTVSNVDFSWTCRDFSHDIWLFGDSYFSYGENRWVYYLITNDYSDNCLFDAYAGEPSERAIASLKSYIGLCKPKYIVWCLGMNDGSDGSSVPKAVWLTAVNEVISICKNYDIIPIFGTIPTVPTINHEQKNAWIRQSGYQYIDFAKAVGAQSDGTWFTGMLANDGVHPTTSGAMALYYQAITDCPQLTLK